MSKGFKNNFRTKAIQKAIKGNNRTVAFPNFETIQSVGVVAYEGFSEDIIEKLKPNAAVTCLLFSTTKRRKGDSSEFIFTTDLNFWGLPTNGRIESFTNLSFDILLNLTFEPSEAIDYVCARSNAKFKVSSTQNGLVYDLVITGLSDQHVFIDELKKALKNFNNKT